MPDRIRFVSICFLTISGILLTVSFATADRGISNLGADYAGFYTAGWLLNHNPAPDLYNREIQDRTYHAVHPQRSADESLPFLHPPFVAVAFQPLACLSYAWSFAVWLLISLGLYLTGLFVTLRSMTLSSADRLTATLAALSFEPFVMDCWQGGQLSAVGFCSFALAAALDSSGRRFAAGLALGVCLYKPTLLVVILPVLVVARNWRTLAGVVVAGAVLSLMTLASVGWDGSLAFASKLLGFSRDVTASSPVVLKLWKYVDLNAFTQLLLGRGWIQRLLFVTLVVPPLAIILVRAWPMYQRDDHYRRLVWAAVLVGTPVVNFYVGIYDSVLAALGGLLAVDALWGAGRPFPKALPWWLGALYWSSWITQPLAMQCHVQAFTLVLVAFTVWISVRGFRAPLEEIKAT